ncbi:Hemolysin erythrocyte lysis protein [Sphingobium herbicidovorans NBRC 16415]|uniref:Hemolysin erythrocyte lysis protein n=4 Tax=Sphingobium herbicidovorans TaxID=76947 RepID=A0A086PCD9_SPHHM|nr:VCBS domain-containing protein [Sphingobium herbicidovorans]KFG91057.1 Hemolysin erythrocyte lysis protein [Sphingobium herbicidovorans NBRC 16415]
MDFEREWNVDAAADRQQAPEPELAALAARVKGDPIQPGSMRTVTPGADGVVVLPAGTDINQIEVDGRNLVVTLPDGTQMVILDGAVVVPRIVVGDVEIPSVNLAALLIGEEPQPAAGPARSSGGNFLAADGKLGDPYALGDLLPPTELSFTQPEEQEILPFAPTQDDEPEVQIVTPDQPAGATSATAVVSEAGLPARGEEPAGSAAAGDSERTTGAIVFSANDGPSVVAIGGVAVTAVGQTFTTPLGVLTITSIEAGSIGYSYTLSDNVVGAPPAEVFTVTVTDADGDQATATLTISITDDGPNAIDDVDSVTEDGPLVADGNVLTGVGGSDVNGTDGVADVQGADGIASVTTGTFEGTYGTLILSAGGGYRYELANGNSAVQFLTPGQTLTDSFSYTITDADGSTSSATLTITINGADDGVTITGLTDGPGANGAELVVLENDLADGSSPDAPALTQGGSFSVSGPDGLTSVTVGGVTVLANGAFVAGQVVTTPLGTLTITGFTATSEQGGVPTAGSFTYSFVLTDNSLNHGAAGADNLFESFAVVATDRNGSTAAGAIDVQIVDDLPTARGDVDGVAAGTYGPERGNVISGAGTVSGAAGADTRGADGAAVAGVSAGAGGAALVNAETVGQVIQGAYGKLTLNGDGSYSYVRDAGTPGGVSDSFTYTLRDGDGDLSTATLRIDIANSEVMIISVPRIGEGTVVDEAGLDAGVGPAPGSNAGADVETTSGVITYSAPDGPSTVTINDIPVTGAGQRIETDKGYLEIISISEGRIEYSYTLTGNTDNSGDEPVTDSFEVTVTDVDGDRATDTLVITILDDHPTAVADVDFVKEDGPLVADGNVLTGTGGNDANGTDGMADIQGADGASVTAISFGGVAGVVGQEIKGAYGTLLIQDDGRYVYTLDNGNGVVQGLDSTETLTEIFTYVITDGDNDSAQASLTITIEGSDDGVTINGLSGQGAELIVREDDLLDGSSPDTGELTQANSFTLTAPDGVATITVGGQTIFANGSFVSGVVISNAYGTLTIDSFTPTLGADGDVIGGTVNYSFVLNDNTLLHTGADGASLANSFPVEVIDSDGSKANASLDVAVLDDAPQARDDAATQPAEEAAMLINVITGEGTTTGAAGADTLGADGVNLAVGGQLVLTSGPAQGTAVYQGNGVFLYTPSAGATGEDQFTYTITDGDGDSSTATVTIVLAGDSTPVVLVSDLTVSEAGLPNGTQAAGNSETASGEMTITTGGDTLAKVEVQGSSGWVDVTGATVGSPVVVQGAAGTLTVTSDGLGKYSYSYTLTANNPTHPDNNPSDGDGISGAADTLPGDSFAVRVTDSDGDVSPSASIDVTVQDDAPVAAVDGDTSVVEGATASGTWSQTIGADQPGATTVVLVGANSYAIGAPIDTGLGTLTVNVNGTWSFVSNNNLNNALNPSLSFTVKVTDADNDVAQDTQTISITDGAGPSAGAPLSLQMDDQNLADGRTPGADDFALGKISFTAGSDALGFAFASSVATLGGGLTWNRVSDTLIEGWDGPVGTGAKIVALTLTASPLAAGQTGNVTVTATLLNNYDSHPTFTADDVAALGTIAVVASDQDGDSVSVAVTLSVSDDIPSLSVDGQTSVVEGATASGTWSQTIGADQPGATTVVLMGANSYAIGAPIDTGLGTLTVNVNGTWSFVSNNNLNNALNPSLSFTVKVTDADNDVAQDTQTISITDGAGPTATKNAAVTVDEEALSTANALGTNPTSTAEAGSDTVSFLAGSDNITGVAFTTVAGITANVDGIAGDDIVWTLDSATQVTGKIGGITAITLTLVPPTLPILAGASGSATVSVTISDNFPHPFGGTGNIVISGITVTATDTDNDLASATAQVTVIDDAPMGTAPLAVSVTNSANQTSSAFLDADFDVDNNYGADGGKIIFTQASTDALIARGLTSGSQSLSYAISADGLTLTASNTGGSVFTVQLQPASFSDKYVVTMHQPLDSLTTVDFNGGGYDFVGGNGAWAGFSTAGNDNSKDLLLTPMTNGADGGTMNTNASEGGVSDGNSVKQGEAVRVDFVVDLTGAPESGKDYGLLANQNHAFEAHYNVNGASALFTSIGNNKTTSVRLVARDDIDADNDIGDGVKDTINAVAISYNGETKQVTVDGAVTVGGHEFNVTFSGQEATVTNVVDNTRIGAFTATQYNSIEFHHAGGDTFKIGDFFAAVQSTQPVNFTIPVTIIDGDGDSTASGNLSITATASTSPVPPIAFDLDGDGLEFVGLSAGVHHDYGAGLVNTAWVSSDDGLLARATGGGYDIVFADDAPGAASDLEGLRLAYDSNGDGVFDAKDAAFGEFGIWQDANSNGRAEAGEFRSLTDAKIAAIELTSDGASYQAAGGDVTVLGEASYIRADGTKGTIGDVMFATSSLNEPSKTTETSSSAFNQALIAASLVAVAGAVEAVEQEPASVVAAEDAPLADTMLASTAPAEAETSLEDSQSTSIGSTEDPALQADDEPVADSSHGGDEPATDHATLADASDAPAPVEASADTAQPDLGDHQGLLAQSIDLPAFDGSAALLAVAQSATTTSVAEVVSEALGAIGATDIDTLLAALPGDIAPALFNPIAAEPIDSGHMAFAASVFDAALAAHDAMAVAHG